MMQKFKLFVALAVSLISIPASSRRLAQRHFRATGR